MKKVLVSTSGGDCPGLNAVIRAIVKCAAKDGNWEVYGCINAYNGLLVEPNEIIKLDEKTVAGIHYRGGTIIGTTNKGGPFAWPYKDKNGEWKYADRSDEMIRRIEYLGINAVISIGGDGSQRISQQLYEKGCPVIGVPKTIDNDLSATDSTFGFQTAVDIATDAVDKLVTTAQSHSRVFILEVMGRDAGWIGLHSAVAGGAEVCLIPEIPYDIEKVKIALDKRFHHDRGFAIVVASEGAKPIDGEATAGSTDEIGYQNRKLGGVGDSIKDKLIEIGFEHDIRVTVLGHLQRGGIPIAYDRVLATEFGVKAFELAKAGDFGKMVSLQYPTIEAVTLKEAISKMKFVEKDSSLLQTARKIGIAFGDE